MHEEALISPSAQARKPALILCPRPLPTGTSALPFPALVHLSPLLPHPHAPLCTPLPRPQALNLFRSKTGVKTHFSVGLEKKVPHGACSPYEGASGARRTHTRTLMGLGCRAGVPSREVWRHVLHGGNGPVKGPSAPCL